MPIADDSAATLALTALTWLVGNDELLPVFLGSTGASADDLRARAGEHEFMVSVLDFLMMDDSWIVEFCDAHTIPYDKPAQAQAVLTGHAHIHWT